MRLLLSAFLLALSLSACGDNFAAVQEADTIQAYEAYIEQNPDSRYSLEAGIRLEELYLEAARTSKSLEAYDTYLQKFPKGVHYAKAREEREAFLFLWAKRADTVESWEKYLAEYKSGPFKKHRMEARSRLNLAGYIDNLSVGEVSMKQVNLAEQKGGPLDGWAFTAEVENKGDKTLALLKLELAFQGADDTVLLTKTWPAAAERYPTPVEAFRKQPMKPGERREWEFWTGDIPEGWTQKVSLKPVMVGFVN